MIQQVRVFKLLYSPLRHQWRKQGLHMLQYGKALVHIQCITI